MTLFFRVNCMFIYENMKGEFGMLKNKLYATLMICLGLASTMLTKDTTLLVFLAVIAVPMFFSKKEWVY